MRKQLSTQDISCTYEKTKYNTTTKYLELHLLVQKHSFYHQSILELHEIGNRTIQ